MGGFDLLDLAIVGICLLAAVGGYRLGFLGRVVSWVGLGVGLYLAVRFLPDVTRRLRGSSPAELLLVAVAMLAGSAMIGQALGLAVGFKLHRALPLGPLRAADRVAGAVVAVVGTMALVWLLIPPLSAVAGWPARAAAGSAIARWASRDLPRPPNTLQLLRRLIGSDAPEVFAALQPPFNLAPPPGAVPLERAVAEQVAASTVKVEGQACGEILEGSGFAVAPDLVVTNAHVVAGEPAGETQVLVPDGRVLAARVVTFDPRIDIALLSVPSLGEAPLALGAAQAGELGAVFGHPNGQDPLAVAPARVDRAETAVGGDLYGNTVSRQILVLAAQLEHGDSGAPLVDSGGVVIGVAFAISANQPQVSYALTTGDLRQVLGEGQNPYGASTGPCLNG